MRPAPQFSAVAVAVAVAALGLCALGVPACRSLRPLPRVPWPGDREALGVLAQRARQVEGFSARCMIRIDPPDRGPATLEGVIVMQRPAQIRVQAWKFDRKVIDLTARGDATWLWLDPRAAPEAERIHVGGSPGRWLGPLLEPLDPKGAQTLRTAAPRPDRFVAAWPLSAAGVPAAGTPPGSAEVIDGWHLVLHIDRPTLTIREVHVVDPEGTSVQRLELQRYGLIGDLPWPTRLTATGDLMLELKLYDIELNPDLPPTAFNPPRDAVKQPDRHGH